MLRFVSHRLSDEDISDDPFDASEVFGDQNIAKFKHIVIQNGDVEQIPNLPTRLIQSSTLQSLVLERVYIVYNYDGESLWKALPACIETINLVDCWGRFLHALDLQKRLRKGNWPKLTRFQISHADVDEFELDEEVWTDTLECGGDMAEALQAFGIDSNERIFDDADYQWPCQGIVDSIKFDEPEIPQVYADAVERAIDNIRYLLATRGVDAGPDDDYFFYTNNPRKIVKPKTGKFVQRERKSLRVSQLSHLDHSFSDYCSSKRISRITSQGHLMRPLAYPSSNAQSRIISKCVKPNLVCASSHANFSKRASSSTFHP